MSTYHRAWFFYFQGLDKLFRSTVCTTKFVIFHPETQPTQELHVADMQMADSNPVPLPVCSILPCSETPTLTNGIQGWS